MHFESCRLTLHTHLTFILGSFIPFLFYVDFWEEVKVERGQGKRGGGQLNCSVSLQLGVGQVPSSTYQCFSTSVAPCVEEGNKREKAGREVLRIGLGDLGLVACHLIWS